MLRPLHKNVILRKERKTQISGRGIVLSASTRRPDTAVVVAVGPDVEDQDYHPGDTVFYKTKDPVEFSEDENEYIILPDEDILAVKEAGHDN